MSVASMLDVIDPHSGPLEVAQARWPAWQERHPALRIVDQVEDLKKEMRRLGRANSNEVLAALVKQGSPSAGNEVAATVVVVWLLLPGACLMAARLRREVPEVATETDQLVAGQVWIEARCVRDSSNYAATILMNAERAIRMELGVHQRSSAARLNLVPTAPADLELVRFSRAADHVRPSGDLPEVEIQLLFDRAIRRGVISAAEAHLILDVARTADRLATANHSAAGLMSGAVSEAVASRYGCSDRAVRRRTHSILAALRSSDARLIGRSA